MSKSWKIVRNMGTAGLWNAARIFDQEAKRTVTYIGSDGKKYNSRHYRTCPETKKQLTYEQVRAGDNYLVEACADWLKWQRGGREGESPRWNQWQLRHHINLLRSHEYTVALQLATQKAGGLIIASTVLDPYHDRHIKVYECEDHPVGWQKSWKRKTTITLERAKLIRKVLRTNKVLFDGVLAYINEEENRKTHLDNVKYLETVQQDLDKAQARVDEYDMEGELAKWNAQADWIANAPEHMVVALPMLAHNRNFKALKHSPELMFKELNDRVESNKKRLDLYSAKIEQYILLHGGGEE
jgi:hypothetical protein